MSIQWFPGHMAKARREVVESLKLVDVVLEVVDARLPESSRNPMMAELTQSKPRVMVLAKADLADPAVTAKYVRLWSAGSTVQAVAVDVLRGAGLSQVTRAAQQVTEEKFAKLARKGIRRRAVRAVVIGIPNTGKSSLINRLAGRNAVRTGDRPGVTRQQQWIRAGGALELLDTPGILWPKFEDPTVALKLAWSGAIKSTLLQSDEIAVKLLQWLSLFYPERLQDRYGIVTDGGDQDDVLAQIARRRGAIRQGGEPDIDLAADFFLRDVQTGMLGPLSFDRPADHGNAGIELLRGE
ncbi:MAG: ribosome biogenesis GTPase YlqF [Bacilli bacterium]